MRIGARKRNRICSKCFAIELELGSAPTLQLYTSSKIQFVSESNIRDNQPSNSNTTTMETRAFQCPPTPYDIRTRTHTCTPFSIYSYNKLENNLKIASHNFKLIEQKRKNQWTNLWMETTILLLLNNFSIFRIVLYCICNYSCHRLWFVCNHCCDVCQDKKRKEKNTETLFKGGTVRVIFHCFVSAM